MNVNELHHEPAPVAGKRTVPSKEDALIRRRAEVAAIGRVLRAFEQSEITGLPAAIVSKHYDKARRLLKQTHQVSCK